MLALPVREDSIITKERPLAPLKNAIDQIAAKYPGDMIRPEVKLCSVFVPLLSKAMTLVVVELC